MKKNILFIIIALVLLTQSVYAVTPTVAPSPTHIATPSSALDKSVQQLKDKIASKVGELRKDEQRVTTGIVTAIDKSNVIIQTSDNKKFTLSIDDTITKIFSVSNTKKEIHFSDLSKGDYLIATGAIIDNTITANVIYRDDRYVVSMGKITELNPEESTIRVISTEKDDIVLTTTKSTKLLLMDSKTEELFSTTYKKIKEGDTIHFVAKLPTDGKLDKLNADRVIIIPQEFFIKK